MNTVSLFESLANTVHHSAELKQLLNQLPTQLKKAFLENDSHQLRETHAKQQYFPDSRTIAQR